MKITDLDNYTVVGNEGTTNPVPQEKTPLSNKIANFFGAKGITEQFGADIARAKAPQAEKDFVQYPSFKEVAGSAIQSGANLLPGAGAGTNLLTKTAIGAGTGYAFDVGSKLQADKSMGESLTPGIGTVVGGATPAAVATVKPLTNIVGRLFKGLGSGLSGVSTDTIEKIYNNPKAAELAKKKLNQAGKAQVLEDNAKQIMEGVQRVRRDARLNYKGGLEALAQTDIDPGRFKEEVSKLSQKYNISDLGDQKLTNFEFTDPKNVTKAHELLDKLDTVKMDGKSLRKLADDIESSAYKIATSDERLSFNAFVRDLSNTLKDAISGSTSKLDEINQSYSSDMQLVKAMEDIFGKVKFNNLPELVRATKKMEGLFNQKGIAPEVIDQFLNKIGVNAEDFKTSEAVRQISNKTSGANAKGLSFGEVAQQLTSSVVTPQMVRDLAIKMGTTEQKLVPELKKLTPSMRNVILNALVQSNK